MFPYGLLAKTNRQKRLKEIGTCTTVQCIYHCYQFNFKVARYSFSGSIPPKFEHKLRRKIQSFGKIATTVVLDKDENLL